MKVYNQTRKTWVVESGWAARTFLARARGLLGLSFLGPGQGLVLIPCGSIHTFFMGFPINVAFLDRDGRVLRLIPNLGPGRLIPPVLQAHAVVELPAGTLAATGTQAGDLLVIQEEQEGQ